MTRAEKEAFQRMRLRLALAWPPEPPAPVDAKVALGGLEWVRLWWFNLASGQVAIGVTNGRTHSRMDYSDQQLASRYIGDSRVTMSQGGGGPWYVSKLAALQALHHARATEYASELLAIQDRVESAASDPET